MAKTAKIQELSVEKLKPYENNARTHDAKQVDMLAASISEFGFINPVLIDKNLQIIAGHGRILAAKQLGLDKVPCVYIEGLSEAQKKAYILADNRLAEMSGWDMDMVTSELEELDGLDFNVDLTGFSVDDLLDDLNLENDSTYGDERERTNNAYNLGIAQELEKTKDFWQMPVIRDDGYIPDRLIGFNYAKTSKEKKCGIHFFVDDYQFERVWSAPEKYVEVLSKYDCILSPDFSLYMDMDMPTKIWNVYRSRFIGAYYQGKGIKVIPTISWAEKDTFKFCFKGIPQGSIVAVSTIGVKEQALAAEIWTSGMDEARKQIKPKAVIEYGGDIGYDYGDITVTRFDNEVTKRWKE